MSTRKSRAGRRWGGRWSWRWSSSPGPRRLRRRPPPQPTPLAKYREPSRQAEKLSQDLLGAQADLDRKQADLDRAGQDLTAAKNAGATAAADKARRQVDVDRCSVVCLGSAEACEIASSRLLPSRFSRGPGAARNRSVQKPETGGERVRSEVWQPQTWTDVWQRRSQVGSGAPTTGSGKCLSFNASTSVDPCTLAPGWTNPTPEFLARAPRDPAVIKAQLAAAVPHSDAGVEQPAGTYAELVILRGAARANGLPADLSRALQRTAALLAPASPAHNLDGVPGTAYTLKGTNGVQLVVLFDADGTYLGSPTESVTRGAAAELGGPPVKLFP